MICFAFIRLLCCFWHGASDQTLRKDPTVSLGWLSVITIVFIIRIHPEYHTVHLLRRVTLNALVDIGCVITFIPSLITGLVLYFFLPSGGGRGGSWVTWMGVTRHDWIFFHDGASFLFAALLILHLLLHVRFFKNIRKAFRAGGTEADDCSMQSPAEPDHQ